MLCHSCGFACQHESSPLQGWVGLIYIFIYKYIYIYIHIINNKQTTTSVTSMLYPTSNHLLNITNITKRSLRNNITDLLSRNSSFKYVSDSLKKGSEKYLLHIITNIAISLRFSKAKSKASPKFFGLSHHYPKSHN